MNAISKTAAFDYDAYNIVEESRKQLESSALFIQQIGRKSTEQAFELGKQLAIASDLLPEGFFGKWAGKRCGMTERHARNFRAIHRSLASHRETLVELAVNSTVLFRLTTANEHQIQAALDLCKEKGAIKVKDVQAILAGDVEAKPPTTVVLADVGGIDGLKAIIADKAMVGLRLFLRHLEFIQIRIAAALSGKRVVKSKLADEIEAVARIAKAELVSLALLVTSHSDTSSYTWNKPFPTGSRWKTVFDLLHKLGGRDSWPEIANMSGWLRSEVLPALEWATAKTKNPEWGVATVGKSEPHVPEISENLRNGLAALGGDVVIERPLTGNHDEAGRAELQEKEQAAVVGLTESVRERKSPPFIKRATHLTVVPAGDANLH
jgi:hypothetical protein